MRGQDQKMELRSGYVKIAMENPIDKWRSKKLGKSSISMDHFPKQIVK